MVDSLRVDLDSLQSATGSLEGEVNSPWNETVDLRTNVDSLRSDLDGLSGSGGSTYIIQP